MTERRSDYNAILERLELLHREREEVDARRHAAFMARMEELRGAFPDGDLSGHCRWHEAEISRIEERTALYRDIRASVLKWGVIALLGWLAVAVWHAVLASIPGHR